jgi:hypothetical protein
MTGARGRYALAMVRPNAADRQAQADIAAALGDTGFALPGTLVERRIRCGKPGCRCAVDPTALHGPYYSWTRKVAGKTVTRLLSAAQAERYRDWFSNARRIRDLAGELEALSLAIAESTEDWG